MSKFRRQLSSNTSSSVEPKKLSDLKEKTGNLYESIAVIAKRANQINITIKKEMSILTLIIQVNILFFFIFFQILFLQKQEIQF